MSNEVKHPTHPVQIDNDPPGVYINARDAGVWYHALQRLLGDAVREVNVRAIETKEPV